MTEHIHGCLNCRPEMVPDCDRADPRYHDGAKCGSATFGVVLINGAPISYTLGVFEGPEGWVLFPGATTDAVHLCPNCTTYSEYQGYQVIDHHEVCVEPRFGRVEIHHEDGR